MPDQSKYTSKLSSSNVLIIGGSSGIGFCVAEASLEHGAHICISSSNSERVQRAVSLLQERYPSYKANVHGLTVDLSDAEKLEGELKGLCDGAVEKFGGQKMDHVVFTAGDGLAMIPLRDMVSLLLILLFFLIRVPKLSFLPIYVHSNKKKGEDTADSGIRNSTEHQKHHPSRHSPFLRSFTPREISPRLRQQLVQILLHHHHRRRIGETYCRLERDWELCGGTPFHGAWASA